MSFKIALETTLATSLLCGLVACGGANDPPPAPVVDGGAVPDDATDDAPDPGELDLVLADTGFFVDGSTWWSASSGPALVGTVANVNMIAVAARVGTLEVTGQITGDAFRIQLPDNALDADGKVVTIIATDPSGAESTIAQHMRFDGTPPVLALQNATVYDEAADRVTFTSDADPTKHEAPRHLHGGTPVQLDASGCPTITKYAYLLGAAAPAYAAELPARNPIRYPVTITDDGVGLEVDTARYRAVRRGSPAVVVRDWGPMPAGVPVSQTSVRHDVGLYAGEVTGLATTEGTYDVELEATDRLGRATLLSRCFQLRLKAAPLHITKSGVAQGHGLALDALSLDSSGVRDISLRLLNPGGEGAGLVEQRLVNGTASPVYMTFTLTRPVLQAARRKFRRAAARTSVTTVSDNCSVANPPAHCENPAPQATYSSAVGGSGATDALDVVVKVFETDASGAVVAELPCAGCTPSGTRFGFTIPARGAAAAPRYFLALAMIDPRPELYPSDATYPSAPPYSEPVLAGVGFTGKQAATSTSYCSRFEFRGPTQDLEYCVQKTTYRYYHALESVELVFGGATTLGSETSLDPTHTPQSTGGLASRAAGTWARTQTTFPQ